jgi:hypothetical protein
MGDNLVAVGGCNADCCYYGPHVELLRMQLYCWPCETVHELSVPDVERLVYGFVGTVAEQNKSGTLAIADVAPPCLLDVLQAATDGDHFQFVDLTIINRGGDPG